MIGETISHYRIVDKLGEGGMGLVYKAEDANLHRLVALKFLRAEAVEDPGWRARFSKEAEAAAALNHPNITTIYEIGEANGQTFLAMALEEGKSLAEKIKQRPLPLEEAMRIGSDVAAALQAAHQRGIVHRDVKPSNVMITADDRVKVMDFGLAHLAGQTRITKTGKILGTPAYMSPEQAQGKPVDHRSDIFSLGAVLYEMVTGRMAFQGENDQAVIYAIISQQPEPLTALRTGLPTELDRIILKALAKDPGERYQHAADLVVDLKGLRRRDDSEPSVSAHSTKRRPSSALGIAAAVIALLAFLAGWLIRSGGETSQTLRRLSVAPPPTNVFDWQQAPAISPDGANLAFVADNQLGEKHLWLRGLDETAARLVPDTEGASGPFWSPDGRSLAFFANGALRTIDLAGGPNRTLAKIAEMEGGTWSEDGEILFAPSYADGRLWRVSAEGGDATPLTKIEDGEMFHRFPSFLPDGRRFLFVIQASTSDASGLYLGSLDSDERTRVGNVKSRAVYVELGYLLFMRQRVLVAQPFDLKQCQLRGEPVIVGERVASATNLFGQAAFSVSNNGVLVYRNVPRLQLVWFDRGGRRVRTVGELGEYSTVSLSSDDQRIVFELLDPETHAGDIWTLDVARGTETRLTSHPDWDMMPAWFPDGNAVLFSRQVKLYQTAPDGTREEEHLEVGNSMAYLPHVSPDGRFLVYCSRGDVWAYPMTQDGTSFAVVETPFLEQQPQLSRESRLLAYTSTETGAAEVYVQTFPGPGSKLRISTRGGSQPRFRADGKALFYVDPAGRLMGVPITNRNPLQVESPELILHGPIMRGASRHHYAVSSSGDRFLATVAEEGTPSLIHVVLNWVNELGPVPAL